MDINLSKPLSHYLACAQQIHTNVINNWLTMRVTDLNKLILELQSNIALLQMIAKKSSDVCNFITLAHKYKASPSTSLATLSITPTLEDYNALQTQTKPVLNMNGAKIYAPIVANLSDCLAVPIYYVKSINQYAININGMILRGNIGNVVDKHFTTYCVKQCVHGNTCQKLLKNKRCGYFHDPLDLVAVQHLIRPCVYKWYMTQYQNFVSASKSVSQKDLALEIEKTKVLSDTLQPRKAQLMHDLLVANTIYNSLPNKKLMLIKQHEKA